MFLKNLFAVDLYNALREEYDSLAAKKQEKPVAALEEERFVQVIKDLLGEDRWKEYVKEFKSPKNVLMHWVKTLCPEFTEQQRTNYDKACRDWLAGRRTVSYAYTSKKCPLWVYLFASLHSVFEGKFTLEKINELRRAFHSEDDTELYVRNLQDLAAFYVIYTKKPAMYGEVLTRLEDALAAGKKGELQKYKTRTIEISQEVDTILQNQSEEIALDILADRVFCNPVEYMNAEHNTIINQAIDECNRLLKANHAFYGGEILRKDDSGKSLSNTDKLKELIQRMLELIGEENESMKYIIEYYDPLERYRADVAELELLEDFFMMKIFRSLGFFEKKTKIDYTKSNFFGAYMKYEYVADFKQARGCLLLLAAEDAIERARESGRFNAKNVVWAINEFLGSFGMRTLNLSDSAWNNDVFDWYVHSAIVKLEKEMQYEEICNFSLY